VLKGVAFVGPGPIDAAVRLGLAQPITGPLPGFAAPPCGPGVVVGYRLGF